ncbi:hypothetical protein [Brevibacillus brevis]|uniref:hypothetical protein n=1 Tax=Brevibacillus brevis TaxID=1393 RepID=UPI0007D8BF2D|nr:hypothetical protein [Brevibacillus brevis]
METEVTHLYLCYFNDSGDLCESEITDDEDYALTLDPNPTVPTIDDLKQHRTATGEVFQGILNTYEGLVMWIYNEDEPEHSSYVLIKEKGLAA